MGKRSVRVVIYRDEDGNRQHSAKLVNGGNFSDAELAYFGNLPGWLGMLQSLPSVAPDSCSVSRDEIAATMMSGGVPKATFTAAFLQLLERRFVVKHVNAESKLRRPRNRK